MHSYISVSKSSNWVTPSNLEGAACTQNNQSKAPNQILSLSSILNLKYWVELHLIVLTNLQIISLFHLSKIMTKTCLNILDQTKIGN